MRRDQPPPLPRDAVELCFSSVIPGCGNNTGITRSVKLPFPEAALQPAPVGTGENAACGSTGEADSGPLRPYKPQLVGITLIRSIQRPCKEWGEALSAVVSPSPVPAEAVGQREQLGGDRAGVGTGTAKGQLVPEEMRGHWPEGG